MEHYRAFFPPAPTFTEKDLPSLQGKVFIVTGGNSGIGLEIVKILYAKGGTVYIAGRSPTKISMAVDEVKALFPDSKGRLKTLEVDLSDLRTVKPCAESFLSQENRLDVLFNNAGIGVGTHKADEATPQGFEIRMGTNCLSPFLLTKLLLPTLRRTAEASSKGAVRVVFTSSGMSDIAAPLGGVLLSEQTPGNFSADVKRSYGASKAGNWILASEFDKRERQNGILCVDQNPGNLSTPGWKKVPVLPRTLLSPFLHAPIKGAYTGIWAGLSPDVKMEDGGKTARPWGRWHPSPRKDILEGLKTKGEGGTGVAAEFWDWCEESTKEFA